MALSKKRKKQSKLIRKINSIGLDCYKGFCHRNHRTRKQAKDGSSDTYKGKKLEIREQEKYEKN